MEDKIADQKKWFKVWTTLLMDSHIRNEDIGMFARLGCAIAFRGINGKLVTTNQALHSLLQIKPGDPIPQSFLDDFNVRIHQNGNDKITVTFLNWYKYQVDNSADRVAKHRRNVTRNVTVEEESRVEKIRKDKIREEVIPDSEFLNRLKNTFSYVDLDHEIAKMQIWLTTPKGKGRKLTRRFMLNWLGKIDKPLKEEDRYANL